MRPHQMSKVKVFPTYDEAEWTIQAYSQSRLSLNERQGSDLSEFSIDIAMMQSLSSLQLHFNAHGSFLISFPSCSHTQTESS
eukprot:g73668.t1